MRSLALALLLGVLDAPPDAEPLPASTTAPLPAELARPSLAAIPTPAPVAVPVQPPEPPPAPAHEVALAAAVTAAAPAAVPWAPGEVMEFDIDYLGIGMGKSTISVGPVADGAVPVALESHTTGIGAIVKFRQVLISRLDLTTLLPVDSELEAWEPGDYHHLDTARFDRAARLAIVRERGKFDKTYQVPVPDGALDFVGLVFRLRTLPLEDGARHEFQVLAGRTVNRVVAEVVKRESVRSGAGKLGAVKVKVPTGLSGKFSEKNPTYVWFSDDARRIVVRIASDFSIGGATATLKRYRPGGEP